MKKCCDCGQPHERLSKKCRACVDKENLRQRKQYQERLSKGLCPRCGEQPKTGSKHCDKCAVRGRDKDRRVRSSRFAKGMCVKCGQNIPTDSLKTCNQCLVECKDSYQQRNDRLTKAGLCTRCGQHDFLPSMKERVSKYRECIICYLKRTSRINLGSEDFADLLLAKLEAQNWSCPYTGDIMVLGDNDSVDHILPRKRFPNESTNPDNIEWITRRANIMKHDRTPDEFLSLIKQIHDHRRL